MKGSVTANNMNLAMVDAFEHGLRKVRIITIHRKNTSALIFFFFYSNEKDIILPTLFLSQIRKLTTNGYFKAKESFVEKWVQLQKTFVAF